MSVMEIEEGSSSSGGDPVAFKYVCIPCDSSRPMEELTMHTTKAEIVGCLMENLRTHFAEAAKLGGEKQKAILMKQMEENLRKQGQEPGQITPDMMSIMAESQTVDIVPLIPAVPGGGYVSVSLYVDDKGTAKELQTNVRATGIVSAIGGNTTVVGDAFIARAYDNEAEDMVRMDFTIDEAKTDGAWVQEAWRVKGIVEANREGGKAAPQITAKDEHPDGYPFAPPFDPPMDPVQRLQAADAIKAKGNELFKAGSLDQATLKYEKALRYLEAYPGVEGEGASASKISCSLNSAMCHLKSERFPQCIKACERALELDPKNVKGHFRKGSAHRAQGEWEAAVGALERAAELDPKDAAVKCELAKADKQLKKFRYGW